MKKIKMDKYNTPNSCLLAIRNGYLKKDSEGLLLDMSDLPEGYEVVIRPIKNMKLRRREQIVYQNLKERE